MDSISKTVKPLEFLTIYITNSVHGSAKQNKSRKPKNKKTKILQHKQINILHSRHSSYDTINMNRNMKNDIAT